MEHEQRSSVNADSTTKAPLPLRLRDGIISRSIPKHTETSLYILALSFLITTVLSADFRSGLAGAFEPNADGGAALGIAVFFAVISVIIFAAVVPSRVIGFRTVLAPFFIVVSSGFLTLEYISAQIGVGGLVGIVLAAYHALTLFVLMMAYRVSNKVSKNISDEDKTPIINILTATLIIVLTFTIFYELTDWHELSWALPITMSGFVWQVIKTNLRFTS